MNGQKLLFVYNANRDWFSAATDFAHKILSPSTYACQLCTLTYGNFSMKQEWKSFIKGLPLEAVFLYKDEFEKQYNTKVALPAIYILEEGAPREMIGKDEIESCPSLEQLQERVAQKIKEYGHYHHSNL